MAVLTNMRDSVVALMPKPKPAKGGKGAKGGRARGPRRAGAGAAAALLPTREFTISAWVTIDHPINWGGIFSALQDNGNAEKGLVLGYDNERFYVGLATEGGSDEDGTIEYLRSTSSYEQGRWHHVAATYDGETLMLYVNGEPAARSDARLGV